MLPENINRYLKWPQLLLQYFQLLSVPSGSFKVVPSDAKYQFFHHLRVYKNNLD
jgi:hypothetical protein